MVDEVREARVPGPDQAPYEARHDQNADHVASPDMHRK